MAVRHILFGLLPLFALISTSSAQTTTKPSPPAAPVVTVAATSAGVRFAALGPVKRTRLEVYDSSGSPIFDSGFLPGNVRDWQPARGGLADGAYTCVLTSRDLAGRLSIKQGAVVLAGGQLSLALGGAEQVGEAEPRQADETMTDGEAGAATLVTHDGVVGALTSTAGDLTLRTGDLLSGEDEERVRVTADGRVGVGTSKPEAALDVAGAVRARDGYRFADGTTLKSEGGRLSLTGAAGDPLPGPSAAGSGTQNRLAKWAETGGAGTLTDSSLFETGGFLGIGTTAPEGTLHIQSPDTTVFKVVSSGTAQTGRSVFQMYRGTASAANGWDFGYNTDLQTESFIIRELTNGAPATRFAIRKNTGRIGIGTSAPAELLDVQGNIRVSGVGSGLVFPDGTKQTTAATGGGGLSAVAHDASLTGNGTTGAPLGIANGQVVRSINGLTDAVTLEAGDGITITPSGNTLTVASVTGGGAITQASGNVGIGTADPQAKLDVNGAARFTPGGSGGVVNIGSPGGTETGMSISNVSTRAEMRFDGTSLKLVAGPAGGPPSITSGVTVNTAGNVGIGTSNPPIAKLHVLTVTGGLPGIYAESLNRGVWGKSTGSSFGVYGESGSGIGVQGVSTSNVGVGGISTSNFAVAGTSTSSIGVRGVTASGSVESPGVRGVSTGAGGVGVRGDGATGVYGVSASGVGVTGEANASGSTGVYGTSTSGYAVYANGNAGQALDKGGFVKAMVYVNPLLPADQYVVRCYNGMTNSSTGNCGFTVTRTNVGRYEISFGFSVENRFPSVTPRFTGTAASAGPFGNFVGVSLIDAHIDIGEFVDSPFYLLIY